LPLPLAAIRVTASSKLSGGTVPDIPGSPPGGEQLSALLHELAEPLTALENYSAAARRLFESEAGGSDAKIKEILDKISCQARRAGEIVPQLRRLLLRDFPNSP
jgi:hypothetical protein